MAIQDNVTKEYFKIVYDECCVQADCVFVSYQTYITPTEREKEKNRAKAYDGAFALLMKKRADIDKKFLEIFGEHATLSQEVFEQRKKTDASFKGIWEEYCAVDRLLYHLPQAFYHSKSTPCDEALVHLAVSFGIPAQLCNDPIQLSRATKVNCGAYGGEKVDAALFYKKLKESRGHACLDC